MGGGFSNACMIDYSAAKKRQSGMGSIFMDKKRIIHIDTKDSNSTTDKVPQISGINPVNDRTSKISGINLINDETSKVLDLRHIIMRNMPVIDPDTLRLIGETMRKWARENVILLTMAQHWKDINGVDLLDDDNPIEADTPDADAEGNSLIEALQILATAYSETHGGIDAIISDDGMTFDLPPEAEADINALIDEYSAFHSNSGAESYVVTAQIFAKGYFHTTDTHDIIISDRITAISLRDFQFALTTRPNPTAFIAPLGTGAFTRFRYDDATGKVINIKTGQPVQETQTPAETASMMKTQADTVTTPDFVLLTALYSVLLRNAERFEGDNIIVPIKPFARELGVDLGGGVGHVKDLEKRFQVYDPYVGWINGQGLLQC